jgi:hypothetical protein
MLDDALQVPCGFHYCITCYDYQRRSQLHRRERVSAEITSFKDSSSYELIPDIPTREPPENTIERATLELAVSLVYKNRTWCYLML